VKRSRSPYGNTKKRKAALAWMAARGITQPRALYPQIRQAPEPVSAHKIVIVRDARLTFARPRVVS
jgi:hypothetical protein